MIRGDIVANRFEIEYLAGEGGIGRVYRAKDRVAKVPVALKIVADCDLRFRHEARILSELRHPAVVRYAAHGELPDGGGFMAMEWLDGRDLATVLRGDRLTFADSLTLGRRLAAGLAAAHARGVVHRDIKPSNIFLVGGETSSVKLIDFGVAKFSASGAATTFPLTHTGAVLGTVGYMAPEQAMGERAIDTRADVFSLGCVLFECLTGRPAFTGNHLVAVLAKILRDDVPRVSEFRRDLPAEIDELVARMLSKKPSDRPKDGAEVARLLEDVVIEETFAQSQPAAAVSSIELRLQCVILANLEGELTRVQAVAGGFGAYAVELANGSFLISFRSGTGVDEQALQGVACALALRDSFRQARIGVATERVHSDRPGKLGPPLDRAAALLGEAGVWIDELTATLVETRYELSREPHAYRVALARESLNARTLLGKSMPCVGRDKELALLEAIWSEVVSEPVARAVLVTGAPGQGKSRLCIEFCRRVSVGDPRILIARGNVVGAGSALVLARQLVRQALRIRDRDEPAIARQKAARFADAISHEEPGQFVEFLLELSGFPVAHAGDMLRAARSDSRVMSEWLRRTFQTWLGAECATGPLLVVLDDVHWGDVSTMLFLRDCWRRFARSPLMVLGLARPEVREVQLHIWDEVAEVRLGGLGRSAANALVESVFGASIDRAVAERIIALADGNPYYLEELIRHVAERRGARQPSTVLAMTQSRMNRLEPEARRMLRAASVFGDGFSGEGVAELIGAQVHVVEEWLDVLAEREFVLCECEPALAAASTFRFRHALVQETAYAMLPAGDRAAAHARAAAWLETRDRQDAGVLAEHWEKANERTRAADWLTQAAEEALIAADLHGALSLSERAEKLQPSAAFLARLLHVRAQAQGLSEDWSTLRDTSLRGLTVQPLGSGEWWLALAGVAYAAMSLGDAERIMFAFQEMLKLPEMPQATRSFGFATFIFVVAFIYGGHPEAIPAVMGPLNACRDDRRDPLFAGWSLLTHSVVARALEDDVGGALRDTREAVRTFDGVADSIGADAARSQLPLVDIGLYAEAEEVYRVLDSPAHAPAMRRRAECHCALAWILTGKLTDGLALAQSVVAAGEPFTAQYALAIAALGRIRTGAVDDGYGIASKCLEIPELPPLIEQAARTALAEAALVLDRPDEALRHAECGLAAHQFMRSAFGSLIHLHQVEALQALGREKDVERALLAAAHRIDRIVATLSEASDRTAFLTLDAANSRTLELAAIVPAQLPNVRARPA